MPARLWNCAVLMTVMVAGTSGMPMPSFAQAKEQMPTFDLDRIIDLAHCRSVVTVHFQLLSKIG